VSLLTDRRTYTLLSVGQIGDAVICAIPTRTVTDCLDDVEFPKHDRWIFAVIKAMSAIGLLSVWRYPAIARLTTFMLTVYFVLAIGAHIRVRDFGRNAAAATTLLAIYGAMTAKGPAVSV
jgi:hypothetical protein